MGELIMYKDSDLCECARIYREAFTTPPLNYDFLTQEKVERYLRDLAKTPNFIGYTYHVDGMITVCFGKLDNYFQGTMFEVSELAVSPTVQRNGIGSEIMRLLEIKLAGYGVAAINLHTSRNLPAYDFYMKNGYGELEENATLIKWLQ
jgi:aminoglycoside 6'-N-acetyltransferase I